MTRDKQLSCDLYIFFEVLKFDKVVSFLIFILIIVIVVVVVVTFIITHGSHFVRTVSASRARFLCRSMDAAISLLICFCYIFIVQRT